MREAGKLPFHEFVHNSALIAIDAEARLLKTSDPVSDPINRVQFAIFTPQLFGVNLAGIANPVSGFVAAHESGARTKTGMYSRRAMHVDLGQLRFSMFDTQRVALPYPVTYRLTQSGMITVSFMGFGETADYHVVINMRDPDQAYMVAMQLDGTYQEYRLSLPKGASIEHWVIGLQFQNEEYWTRILDESEDRGESTMQVASTNRKR